MLNLRNKVSEMLGESLAKVEPKKDPRSLLTIDTQRFSDILPFRFFDEEHGFFINEGSIGFGFELSPLSGIDEKVIEEFTSFFNDKLDDTVYCQQILFSHNKIGRLVESKIPLIDGKYSSQQEIMQGYFKSLATKGFTASNGDVIGIKDFRSFFFVSTKDAFNHKTILKLNDLRSEFEVLFKDNGISNVKMDAAHLIALLRNQISYNTKNIYDNSSTYNEHEEIASQVLDPSFELKHREDHLDISFQEQGQECKTRQVCLSLRELPDEFAAWMSSDNYCNILKTVRQIRCPFVLSVSFQIENKAAAKTKAQKKFIEFEKKAKSQFAKYISGTNKVAEEWKRIRDQLSDGEIQLTKMFFNLTLITDEKNQKEDIRNAESAFRYNGVELYITKYMQLQSLYASLPFCIAEGIFQELGLGRLRTVTTFNLVNLLPLVGEWKGCADGVVIPTKRNQLSSLNVFDSSLPVTNYNLCINGVTGSGKSFFTQGIIQNTLTQGGKVWVVDLGESFKNSGDINGAVYISAKNLQLNPFSNVKNFSRSAEKIRDLLSILANPNGTFTKVQEEFLLDAVTHAWEKNGNKANIDDVLEYLNTKNDSGDDDRLGDMVLLLTKYASNGMYESFFNQTSQIQADSNYVILELGEIEAQQDLLRAVLFAFVLYVEEQMYESDRSIPKMCVIDEAWRFLGGSNPKVSSFIEKGYRTSRKHKGSFVSIAQNMTDFQTSTEAQAAWANSAIKITLMQDHSALDTFVKDNDSLNPFEVLVLKSFKAPKTTGYSSLMVDIGGSKSFHNYFVDPFTRIMCSTDADVQEKIKQQVEQGVSTFDAIKKIATERYHGLS